MMGHEARDGGQGLCDGHEEHRNAQLEMPQAAHMRVLSRGPMAWAPWQALLLDGSAAESSMQWQVTCVEWQQLCKV